MTFNLRASVCAVLWAASAAVLLAGPRAGRPAFAQTPLETLSEPEASSGSSLDPDSNLDSDSDLDSETANYSDGTLSIDYPATWEIEVVDNGVTIANVTDVASDAIYTQVARVAAPPGAVVNANIDSFIAEGSAVSRYGTATIDGQSAVRMWLADRPDSLGQAIATFIGYGNETVLLFSRYSAENAEAEASILRLHGSFSNTATDTATETAPPDALPDALPETGPETLPVEPLEETP